MHDVYQSLTTVPVYLTTLTDEDFADLDAAVTAERSRRATLQAVPQQMAALNRAYQNSSGYEAGKPWVQPTGSVGAYMTGDTVTHRDTEWQSLIDWNVTEPGNPADPQAYRWWGDLGDADNGDNWRPGATYAAGDTVTYDGADYICLQGHTAQAGWEPPTVPALWRPVE